MRGVAALTLKNHCFSSPSLLFPAQTAPAAVHSPCSRLSAGQPPVPDTRLPGCISCSQCTEQLTVVADTEGVAGAALTAQNTDVSVQQQVETKTTS